MQEKPKPDEVEDSDTWGEDQKDREYYYDDAHGYEPFEPDEEEGSDAESEGRGEAEPE